MKIEYINSEGDFRLTDADDTSCLYFPMGNEDSVMASITPILHGDNKTGQNSFLMEPVSIEDLQESNSGRNVWLRINEDQFWAANGCSPLQNMWKYGPDPLMKDLVTVEAGKLWHQMIRRNDFLGLTVTIKNFVPIGQEVELMKVTISNHGDRLLKAEPVVAVPIYGRSAENIRDHRHVTSLLHRIRVAKYGVEVKPTLSFDERGHQVNEVSYGVYAKDDKGNGPVQCYPVMEEFRGEGRCLHYPKAVWDREYAASIAMREDGWAEGFEAIGALEMNTLLLNPGEERTLYISLGYHGQGIDLLNKKSEEEAFDKMLQYWKEQTGIVVETGDEKFDLWLRWVGIQPTLRRIFGCSFLPHHDYGRGGRGYRDLWQDSLALLLISKESIRHQLLSYYGGIRMDGSNATIIGKTLGEFVADRNSIVRMWMDHGVWPFITTLLYINQTGDYKILTEEQSYFKDGIIQRGTEKDGLWNGTSKVLHTNANEVYKGSILEHILVQNLTAFYDVGKHGHMRLLGADWNDALDMAAENGESVAFSAAYAGNLENLGKLLQRLSKEKKVTNLELSQELLVLIGNKECKDTESKRELLKNYCHSCTSYISGRKQSISAEELAGDLIDKAGQIKNTIRRNEWISSENESFGGWFNSYYDNHAKAVEGIRQDGIRMMLTGQVFTILSKTASDEQIPLIVKAADELLFDAKAGGYRLNTNFHEVKTDMGRMFGFAYGSKENGSVFSHMAVMYAYALYSRGFVKEGYKVIRQLYLQASDFEKSRIYPGIPEYFNQKGRGLYNYLTGSASWYMLTVLTEMFGVKGDLGDLTLEPKLVAEQFDEDGNAAIISYFAGKMLHVVYENHQKKEIGDYEVEEIYLEGHRMFWTGSVPTMKRQDIEELEGDGPHGIRVRLS